ncbi:MAG: dockerin type I repeat-containing protein, partial [Ruminococcus sp.]|nr:dockerin type I repeat-containing protein [Ruminococcus sp.]
DINNDGKTDVADLVLLRKHIHNIQPLTVSQAERADICSDNCIDVFDCIMLKQLIIGIN